MAAAAGDVAEGVSEEGLADADGADEGDAVMSLQEAEGNKLIEQGAIEGDGGRRVPVLDLGTGIEAGALGAQGGGETIAAGDLVGEEKEQDVLMRELLLPGQGEALGQGVEDAGEPEPAQNGLQVGRDGVGGSSRVSIVAPGRGRRRQGVEGGGAQVAGERQDPRWGRRRRGRGQLVQPGQAAHAEHVGGEGRLARGIDAGVAVAAGEAEERVGLPHAGPGQVPGQEGAFGGVLRRHLLEDQTFRTGGGRVDGRRWIISDEHTPGVFRERLRFSP
jgi:hypothetical protein